jgi:predicted acetyltransferase
MDHLPALFDRLRANRAGQVNRNETYWADMLASTRRRSGGSSERFFAIGEHGYTSYRATNNFSSDPTILRVDDLFGVSAEVEAGLWQYILNVDLVDSIVANRPLDESIRWRLEDPRSLTVSGLHDFLWIRVLDVAGALTARRYRTDGRLVFEVEPSTVWPDADGQPGSDPAAGRWVLEAGPSGSSCRRARANEPAELVMGVAELGAALLGGQDLMSRSLAGRVTELKPGALVRADSLLGTRPLPFSSTGF